MSCWLAGDSVHQFYELPFISFMSSLTSACQEEQGHRGSRPEGSGREALGKARGRKLKQVLD